MQDYLDDSHFPLNFDCLLLIHALRRKNKREEKGRKKINEIHITEYNNKLVLIKKSLLLFFSFNRPTIKKLVVCCYPLLYVKLLWWYALNSFAQRTIHIATNKSYYCACHHFVENKQRIHRDRQQHLRLICTLVDIEIVGMASLKPSLRKNYMNVKAADGKSLDEKAKQIRADIPKYKASQKKVCIEDILKDSDLGSENIENELLGNTRQRPAKIDCSQRRQQLWFRGQQHKSIHIRW